MRKIFLLLSTNLAVTACSASPASDSCATDTGCDTDAADDDADDGAGTNVASTSEPSVTTGAATTAAGTDADAGEDSESTAGEGSTAESSGAPSDPDAPTILSLSSDVSNVDPGGSITISAIVSDPDGIDDVIGGQLTLDGDDQLFGSFVAAAEEGAYSLTLSFNELIDQIQPDFEPAPLSLVLRAEFFDQSGASTSDTVSLSIGCDGDDDLICGGGCMGGSCHPNSAPCEAPGEACLFVGTDFRCVAVAGAAVLEDCSDHEDCGSGLCIISTDYCPNVSCCRDYCEADGGCSGGGSCVGVPAIVAGASDESTQNCGGLGACL